MLLYGLGCFVELALAAPLASAFFYVPSALAVPANAVMALAWAGLRMLPAPF